MTGLELEELIADCPTLYHVAERGSWPSITQHGLLSTSALLDIHGICGSQRDAVEKQRRPAQVTIQRPGLPVAVIRDQMPMDDASLARCLTDGLSPSDWYQMLNHKVFFWLTRDRLFRLLNAEANRRTEHDVLFVDTRRLIEAWHERIKLCPINSGNTRRFPRPRGHESFRCISAYPYADWRKRRKRGERVVELTVHYAVPDIARFVHRVTRMTGAKEVEVLFEGCNVN